MSSEQSQPPNQTPWELTVPWIFEGLSPELAQMLLGAAHHRVTGDSKFLTSRSVIVPTARVPFPPDPTIQISNHAPT